MTLTIRDEAAAGRTTGETAVEFLTERVTVRELIRSRVHQEVADHNRRPTPGGGWSRADRGRADA